MSPRSGRKIVERRSYHVTHRCHNREFRLSFAVDRDQYRRRLFEMTRAYPVSVLDYMITCNHVHLLVWCETPDALSEGMRFLQGSFAQDYNRRKGRSGAFWSGRYHSTLIQDGSHLGRCLFYIGLNMVRNKVVGHPSEWAWSGYRELIGERRRYRIIDVESLLRKLNVPDTPLADFAEWYERTLVGKIAKRELAREGFWSEAVAVGDEDWITGIADGLPRGRVTISSMEYDLLATSNAVPLELREARSAYALYTGVRGGISRSRRS